MRITPFLLCLLILVFACKEKTENTVTTETVKETAPVYDLKEDKNKIFSTPEAIAYKYGLQYWNEVDKIKFTYNFENKTRKSVRSYIWQPKLKKVTLITNGDTINYNRNEQLDSLGLYADKRFINDSYWLLAPYKLVWDEGTTFKDTKSVIAPLSKKKLNKLTITYSDKGGYTPGDAYDLYYGNDFLIKEWVFRQGNQEEASMSTTWEDLITVNKLKLSTMRNDLPADVKIYFTDISIN